MEAQIYTFTWQSIEIEARYIPVKWTTIAHLEIRSISPACAPLPMTETGYRSHFHPIGTIERDYSGDVVASVTDWLDKEAQSRTWKTYVQATRQGDLFA